MVFLRVFFISLLLLTCELGCLGANSGSGESSGGYELCENNSDICSQHASCNNTDNGHRCICHVGYSGDGYNCTDIDECEKGINNCHPLSVCTNTVGSFACFCKPGYTGDGVECIDINECDTARCDSCNQQSPGFHCECNEGYIGLFNIEPSTNSKYTMVLYDYAHGDCSPLPYSDCSFSPTGFCVCTFEQFSHDTFCMEIDGCISKNHTCHNNATCTAGLNGNYSCQCKTGFVGDGRTCSDIDECGSSFPPCKNCTNTIGSYSCGCALGFDGNPCKDIDECIDETHDCHPQAKCTNTQGSYYCTCENEYNLSGDNGTWCSGCPLNSWSRWVDSDLAHWMRGNYGRANGLGDFELIKQIRKRFPEINVCEKPTNIEAQLNNGDPYNVGGEIVHIAIDGFYCLHNEQTDGKCHNYYVRFCCPAPQPSEEYSTSATAENKLLPFFKRSFPEIISKYECGKPQISIQWTKSDFLSGFFYKLLIQDMVTKKIKETSVQIALKDTVAIQISASSAGSCVTSSRLSVSVVDSIVINVIAERLNDQIKTIAKVVYHYAEKTKELTFVDFA